MTRSSIKTFSGASRHQTSLKMTRKERKIQALISRICQKIIEAYQPERIILFGSYAYGKPNRDSDIDLFIIKDDPRKPIERNVGIRRIVAEENKKIALTPMVYTPQEVQYRLSIGDDFIEEILTRGKILYAR
jgi:predicted nucleotidyltransferase